MVAGVRRPEMTAREEATTVVIFFFVLLGDWRFGRDEKRGSLVDWTGLEDKAFEAS